MISGLPKQVLADELLGTRKDGPGASICGLGAGKCESPLLHGGTGNLKQGDQGTVINEVSQKPDESVCAERWSDSVSCWRSMESTLEH